MAAGDVTITADQTFGRGFKGDLRMIMGTVVLDGENPTPVLLTNYLSAIFAAQATMSGSAATDADPNQITALINGTSLDIYAWKVTTGGAAGNPTEIASTDNTRVINWLAIGPKA